MTDETLITSAANPTVKWIRSLSSRKHRRAEGAFVVEGLQPVWRAVTSSWPIRMLVVCPELLRNPSAKDMVIEQDGAGVRVVQVSTQVFERLSGRDGPAGLLAVVDGAVADLADFRPRPTGPVVALAGVSSPGNVGTVLRSLDAAGGAGLVLAGRTADPTDPAAVKASMGSLFAVAVAHAPGIDEVIDWARAAGRPLVAVTGHTNVSLWHTRFPDDPVFVFGSEGGGLPDDVAARCETQVAIPMEGTAESLNLATAVSITLFEHKRRRDEQASRNASGPGSGPRKT